MQTCANRFVNITLQLLCLVILLASTGCQPQQATASPPIASTTERLPTPRASQPSTTPVQEASNKPTVDADAHIYRELLPTPSVAFQISPHNQDAQLITALKGEIPVIRIASDSGIGGADVEIVSENYPEQIVLQFHLRGLERLRFTYETTTIEVSLPSGDNIAPIESVMLEGNSAQPITESSPYWMNLRLVSDHQTIPLEEGYIEVEVPPSFLAEQARRFSIQWIDFYR